MAETDEGAVRQVFGGRHGARVLGAIVLAGTCVRVEAYEGMRGESSSGEGDVEATGKMCREVRVRLEVRGQRRERGLSMGASAAPTDRWEVECHLDGVTAADSGHGSGSGCVEILRVVVRVRSRDVRILYVSENNQSQRARDPCSCSCQLQTSKGELVSAIGRAE